MSMEKILVPMTPRRGAFEALSRALSLAKRIPARVLVLYVSGPADARHSVTPPLDTAEDRKRVRFMIERAREGGVNVDSFVTEGAFEEEVVRFTGENKITLVVLETVNGDPRNAERDIQSLREIRHRVACRVEAVTPRGVEPYNIERGS